MMRDASWRSVLAAAVIASTVRVSAAQPAPCDACTRGDAIIDRYSLQDVRPLAGELVALSLVEPLTAQHYARIIELRNRTPALVKLGALDDADLALVAAALCRAADGACTTATTRALRCIADRCEIALQEREQRAVDVVVAREPCRRTRTHPPRLGLGFEWSTGLQRSRYPSDGRAWSTGIETRLRVAGRVGAIARIDRAGGRDAAIDMDDNGVDDAATGSLTRVSALAGPSFMLDYVPFHGTTRSIRLDVLGGYVATRTQADEDGPAVGFDIAHHVSSFRTGVRVVQGLGGARETTMVLGHLGFVVGNGPAFDDADCGAASAARSSRFALGIDTPLGGYGVTAKLGYLAVGFGVEALWFLTPAFDAIARADILSFPGDERDRANYHAVLAGVRIDHGKRTGRGTRTGAFSSVMAGYTHRAGTTPTTAGPGPIADLSVGWGAQGDDGAANLRVHGRFGISADNIGYVALFLSAGFELRFDPGRWRKRI